ncbi:MAG: hypothetical protein RMK29_22395, partial [Myxococcales bacterium]|nr:hypothetical protein [Myxococcales bacterium]
RQRRADAQRLGRPDLAEEAARCMDEVERQLSSAIAGPAREGDQPLAPGPEMVRAPGGQVSSAFASTVQITRTDSLQALASQRFTGCTRIWLLGAAAAQLAQAFKQQDDRLWVGVLLPPGATAPPGASLADRCLTGWLSQGIGMEVADERPQAVVCAGYLEASADPTAELAALRTWVEVEGEILCAFTNAASMEVLDRLACGRKAAGLEVHERLYTPEDIQALLEGSGLRIEAWYGVPSTSFLREEVERSGLVQHIATPHLVVAVTDEAHRRLLESVSLIVRVRVAEARALLSADPHELYALWMATHTPHAWQIEWMRQRMAAFAPTASFHLGIIAEDERINALIGTLAAMGEQLWEHWRITIVARQPCPEPLKGFHPVVQWRQIAIDAEAVAALNAVLIDEQADVVGQLEAGDRLAPHALFSFAEKFALHPQWQAAYCDEDLLDAAGERHQPHFKTDFDIDALRAAPYVVGGVWLMRREAFRQIGGYRADVAGVETYDLQLRTWEAFGDDGIGHIADVLYHRDPQGGHALAE